MRGRHLRVSVRRISHTRITLRVASHHRSTAFTLIELLVAIAIIAIIAGLLLPVFTKARTKARWAYCAGNLRQIGMAVDCYRNDWEGAYPWAWRVDAVVFDNLHPSLPEALQDYVRDAHIWQCPSDIGETFPKGPFGLHRTSKPFYAIRIASYDYYGRGFSDGLVGDLVPRVRKPALAVLCMEDRPWHDHYLPTDDWSTCTGRDNVLYCDGHVARRTVAQIHIDVKDSRTP
ncbi:MAG TPA: prepilin-type N-terminal cleavage/methylation domain-containing protein [Armatimonadota bacterium]|jgi:general secretion pathway protein G